jgi:hypothetical protein
LNSHDELYWNATGNFWEFPIEQAEAQVTLPDGAVIKKLAVYTGRQGDTANDAIYTQTSENSATFRATRTFAPGEGLTIAVLFEKGVMIEPSNLQKWLYYMSDHRNMMPIFAVLLILLYYYFAWNLVGRGPKKGVIVPLCHPPEGFSPALTHFVHHMNWKKDGLTAFSAATISLATKGLLSIGKENNKISFTYQRGQRLKLKLPREESIVRNYFRSKDTLKANKSSGPKLNNTLGKFKKMIESENQDTYFSRNYKYVRISWFLSVLCVFGLSFFGAQVLAPLATMLLGWYVMEILDFDSRWRGFRGAKGGWLQSLL